MDKKIYENTRYQNIYRHKKNKNYIIMISKPVKTSISRIDGKKIIKLEDAINIRDNSKIKAQIGLESAYKEDFDGLWNKYINDCRNIQKLAYNTILRKNRLYNRYLKYKFNKKVSKISKDEIAAFFNNMNSSLKQKNEMIKILKAFFNWCIREEYLIISPMIAIKNYKTEKNEMKYWIPEELRKVLETLNKDIESNNFNLVLKARKIKLFILLQFCLGDRVGETRALTYNSFNENLGTVNINHSINYDRKSNDFLSNTKNYQSQRKVDISDRIIKEIKEYKSFLINYTDYEIKDDDIIFFNYKTKKPLTDSSLRKDFYYYCEKAKVTKIRMYDLRHTYVTTMMAEGKELYYISSRIGHSNYSTTVNKYGHLSEKTRKEIAKITDKYI